MQKPTWMPYAMRRGELLFQIRTARSAMRSAVTLGQRRAAFEMLFSAQSSLTGCRAKHYH
jgi:hypothetical protein